MNAKKYTNKINRLGFDIQDSLVYEKSDLMMSRKIEFNIGCFYIRSECLLLKTSASESPVIINTVQTIDLVGSINSVIIKHWKYPNYNLHAFNNFTQKDRCKKMPNSFFVILLYMFI